MDSNSNGAALKAVRDHVQNQRREIVGELTELLDNRLSQLKPEEIRRVEIVAPSVHNEVNPTPIQVQNEVHPSEVTIDMQPVADALDRMSSLLEEQGRQMQERIGVLEARFLKVLELMTREVLPPQVTVAAPSVTVEAPPAAQVLLKPLLTLKREPRKLTITHDDGSKSTVEES
jgi:hypothetical protein